MTKEIIANQAKRLGQVASSIVNQFLFVNITPRDRFYVQLLQRQSVLLQEIASLLKERPAEHQMPTFILFRCLLDDFITLLYFGSKNFAVEVLIQHTAKAYHEKFKWLSSSRDLNEKYFGGKDPDMATTDLYEKELKEFCDDQEHHIFFENLKERKWKSFISTTEMVTSLEVNEISAANAHAFILWKHLSAYVHYSSYTADLEKPGSARELEISQLGEALTYVYKSIIFCHAILKHLKFEHKLIDPTGIGDELLKDAIPVKFEDLPNAKRK